MSKIAEYLVTAILLLIHTSWISIPGSGARLASSNVVTNLIRIEALDRVTPPYFVLAGSSMTGRIPERLAEEVAGLQVVNLGLDGCGAADGLRYLLNKTELPAVVMMEGNTINARNEENAQTVDEQFHGFGAIAHSHVPFMRYRERPVDLLYSWLYYRKMASDAGAGNFSGDAGGILILPALQQPPVVLPDLNERDVLQGEMESLEALVLTLRGRGVRFYVFMLPDNKRDRSEQYLAVRWLTAKLAIPFLDLKLPHESNLTYSDSVHLDVPSASRVARALGLWIKEESLIRSSP